MFKQTLAAATLMLFTGLVLAQSNSPGLNQNVRNRELTKEMMDRPTPTPSDKAGDKGGNKSNDRAGDKGDKGNRGGGGDKGGRSGRSR